MKTELTDTINLRLRGSYNRRNSENKAAFEPLFIGPDAGNGAGSLFDTLSFDRTNPFNPFGVTLESGVNPDGTPNGRTANYSVVARRLIEAGQRDFHQQVNTYSGAATLDGRFNIGSHGNGSGTPTRCSASTRRSRASPATSVPTASRRRSGRLRIAPRPACP